MSGVVIVPFRREFAGDFRRLNLDWIRELFSVEEADRRVLDDPESAIVGKGGAIFFALDEASSEVIGTAAMIRIDGVRCELAKMAVAPAHRRHGVGELLGRACLEWARNNGIHKVVLETNRQLDGAIRLYERLGFRHAPAHASDYARADVFMELPIGHPEVA